MEERVVGQNIGPVGKVDSKYVKYTKYGLIYFSIIIIIAGIVIGIGAYNTLSYKYVYQGVYINDVHVGGESKASASEKIIQVYQEPLQAKEITLTARGVTKKISCADIDARYNIKQAVLNAYDIGRGGNIFKRLFTISRIKKENVHIMLSVEVDEGKLRSQIKELAKKTDLPVKQHHIEVLEEQIKITNGENGYRLDIDAAVEKVLNAVKKEKFDTIVLTHEVVKPKPIDVDKLYEETYIEPADAYYEVKDYRIEVIPQVIGRKFNKEEAKSLITNNQLKSEFFIPFIFTEPEVFKTELEKQLFKDMLSTYTTSFNAGYVERSHNIALAASKINGTVLAPGHEFSFNEVVGDRTLEAGYKNAHVYLGDKIIDGVGGGICQVSTTLYNAVLYHDLQVTNRVNHSMPVGYVPFGQDAAVAYGILDFKFVNSTTWPLKIVTNVDTKKGKMTFTLYGTDEKPGKTVEIENVVLKTIPFTVEKEEDPELPEGEKKIKQTGGNGYVVDTYKVIKQDGKVVSRKLITKSSYKPIKQIEVIGTKKVEVPAAVQDEVEKPQKPQLEQEEEVHQEQLDLQE